MCSMGDRVVLSRRHFLHGTALGAVLAPSIFLKSEQASAAEIEADEARAIAREATIYGFPLIDNYRVQYSYFVDKGGPEYKADWNTLVNNARVYTPDDKA